MLTNNDIEKNCAMYTASRICQLTLYIYLVDKISENILVFSAPLLFKLIQFLSIYCISAR